MPTATPRPIEDSEPALLVETAKRDDIQSMLLKVIMAAKNIIWKASSFTKQTFIWYLLYTPIWLNTIAAVIVYNIGKEACLLNSYRGSYRCRLPCSFVPEAVSATEQWEVRLINTFCQMAL